MRAIKTALLALCVIGCTGTASQVSSPLIDYPRSGGIRGIDDRLMIRDDGTATLSRNGKSSEITVTSDVMDRLRRALGQSQFGGLRSEYEAPRGGADMYDYAITHKGHTVRAKDASLPEALHPVISILDRILSNAG